jgi:hypothetical protein
MLAMVRLLLYINRLIAYQKDRGTIALKEVVKPTQPLIHLVPGALARA